MINGDIYEKASQTFAGHFRRSHTVTAYAPGRVEVLGNHTDYNEGFVLSAAINRGTYFLAAPTKDASCRVLACDLNQEAAFEVSSPTPAKDTAWANYVKGVFAKIRDKGGITTGFCAAFLGNIPLGAGLSSSAALEMAAGLALSHLYGIKIGKIDMAKIGQAAEHEYAGAKCGLLDQISSLYGQEDGLVMSDFRSLKVDHVPFGADARFLVCNTSVKHRLVDSEYNARRADCEKAAQFFASRLKHPVKALRDVSWEEWQKHSPMMDATQAKRSAHVVGENTRVLQGRKFLKAGNLEEFGRLMFESHESSRTSFENSCKELDFIVATARKVPGAMGARLSGGGFGGSAVVLVHVRDVDVAGLAIATAYRKKFGHPCDVMAITPSGGAWVK